MDESLLNYELIGRYRRQLILKDFGQNGQKLLMQSKVLLVGAGGLGSPVAYYLVAAGVGKIGIVDDDKVDISNLQRQILHNTDDVGKYKVISADEKLSKLNPNVQVKTYCCRLDKNNIDNIINEYDLVVNAVDNIETRYILNDICIQKQKPLVEGAIHGFMGHIMTILPGESACYNCVFPKNNYGKKSEIGALGAAVGIVGTIQALEVIKIITGIGNNLANKLLSIDILNMTFNQISLSKDESCEVCCDLLKK